MENSQQSIKSIVTSDISTQPLQPKIEQINQSVSAASFEEPEPVAETRDVQVQVNSLANSSESL